MKKLLCLILVLCMCAPFVAHADEPRAEVKVKIFSDAKKIEADTVISDNRTLMPIRAVLESTNATLDWDQSTKTASVTRGGKTISVTIGSKVMKTPSGDVALDTAPILRNNTTYAPIRAIAEQFGIKVDWDSSGTKTILLTTPDGCPYVDFYEGMTVKAALEMYGITPEEFTNESGLDYEIYKDKLYIQADNEVLSAKVAQSNSMTFEDLKNLLDLDDTITETTPWGVAVGSISMESYINAFLNPAQYEMNADEVFEQIKMAYNLGNEYNLSTKFRYIRPIIDNIDYQKSKAEEEKEKALAEQKAKDLEELPSKLEEKYYFTITLSDGSVMKGELYPDLAPITVANFVKLVKEKFYDGLIFHRVIDGFMIQGGCYNKNMEAKTSATIKGEFYANGITNALKHEKGVISMARTNDPNSATSQFFIMDEANESLDGNYAAFGKITKGLDVIEKISKVETTTNEYGMTDVPVKPVVIKTIRMSR